MTFSPPGRMLPFILGPLILAGCAARTLPPQTDTNEAKGTVLGGLQEVPVPDGPWRPHQVSWCGSESKVPADVESLLGLCSQYFREGSGTDGMLELELGLEGGVRHPLILMTLGQLYLIAGQGEPDLLPPEGPAADVGDWDRNKVRLLARAEALLTEAGTSRPADAAVDYLLADVHRAREDFRQAEAFVFQGAAKCTSGRGMALLVHYQDLNRYPGRYLGGPGPEYPQDALQAGVTGEVVLDLLVSPLGEVRQAEVVSAPLPSLARAAAISLEEGSWQAATLGKYPIWSWLRVQTSFTLGP